jgi:hypothetical protein
MLNNLNLTGLSLSVGDNDGDPFDPDTEEEFAEGFTVGGVPADFGGYFNLVNPAITTPATLSNGTTIALSILGFSAAAGAVAFGQVALGGIIAGATAGLEALKIFGNEMDRQLQKDPYDPNYRSLYAPITPSLPDLPDGPDVPAGFRADALNLMQAAATVASYADALYATNNRMLSAIVDGDLTGFQLQNAQLNKLTSLYGAAHIALADAETKFADDISSAGLNASVTPAQIADFRN